MKCSWLFISWMIKLLKGGVNRSELSVGSIEVRMAGHRQEVSCSLTSASMWRCIQEKQEGRFLATTALPAAYQGPIPYLLTLPPPGTCFILSLEPHRDCTLLKSNFLSRICTWKINMWGKKTVILEEATAAELQMRTITGEENRF